MYAFTSFKVCVVFIYVCNHSLAEQKIFCTSFSIRGAYKVGFAFTHIIEGVCPVFEYYNVRNVHLVKQSFHQVYVETVCISLFVKIFVWWKFPIAFYQQWMVFCICFPNGTISLISISFYQKKQNGKYHYISYSV